MYTLTRQEAAKKLSISTRSVDRYIKSGKLRSKKDGKIIYIHQWDVNNILGVTNKKQPEVIIPKEKNHQTSHSETAKTTHTTSIVDAQSRATIEKIYLDLRWELKEKDKTIQDLSMRLGQAQEIAKNSVSLMEFKKSQFLLEESKDHLGQENSYLKEKNQELGNRLRYEKNTNIILIIFCVFLVIGIGVIWFVMI